MERTLSLNGEQKRMTRDEHDERTLLVRGGILASTILITLFIAVLSFIGLGRSSGNPPAGETAILVGAGDISTCINDGDARTAELLGGISGTVFTTGDNVYDRGTSEEFANCYDPTWGQYRDRTRPAPGNHDYLAPQAEGYYGYFGVPPYYAYNAGEWRIYALNSEIDVSGNSEQAQWLTSDLAANPKKCVMAYWHRPRWSSGREHGSSPEMQALWDILYHAGAELLITGHEHNYERFATMDENGQAVDPGLRQFVVGTGGASHYDFGSILPASQARNSDTSGVLKLTLRPDGYDWEFISVAGGTFTDSGSASCY